MKKQDKFGFELTLLVWLAMISIIVLVLFFGLLKLAKDVHPTKETIFIMDSGLKEFPKGSHAYCEDGAAVRDYGYSVFINGCLIRNQENKCAGEGKMCYVRFIQ